MNSIVSFFYLFFALIFTASFVVVRKNCTNLVKNKDLLGIFSYLVLSIFGFVVCHLVPNVHFLMGAIYCAIMTASLLYDKQYYKFHFNELCIILFCCFMLPTVTIGFVIYYSLNKKEFNEGIASITGQNVKNSDEDYEDETDEDK